MATIRLLCSFAIVAAAGVCILPVLVHGQQGWQTWGQWSQWNPWRPQWEYFDPYVHVETQYGFVKGFTVPWTIDDEVWREWQERPPWYLRRINCFLGIPYAAPPVGQLRFQRPRYPQWSGTWDATYFRNACPQQLDEIHLDIPTFPAKNVSEDCLYMNIFVPNVTLENADGGLTPDKNLYPVFVWIHSGNFSYGTAQQQPGHVLATKEVVVVTFNYRIGALGFLSTEDQHAPGNWGLFDQQMALDFVRQNIQKFRGDPKRITLAGDGAGGVSVGMHMISAMSRGKNFYHRTIMMSGTDLSMFGYVKPFWRPRDYAADLGGKVGCPNDDMYTMVQCLRDNVTIPWQKIVAVQNRVMARDGQLGVVWAPVQDGGFFQDMPFLYETPTSLRAQHLFERVPSIIGINSQDGAKRANESIKALGAGLFPETFEAFILQMLKDWLIIDDWRERAASSVEFQYSYWPDPNNMTARTQMFIDMVTDLHYGVGMDEVVKLQAEHSNTYMYQFNYKSWADWLPRWAGISHSAAVPYIFGFPFMNETILNETHLVPRQWFDYEDRNMSEWMMHMWRNFMYFAEPTPNMTRNVTWDPYNFDNFSYLVIDHHSNIWYRYRQQHYGFWRDYFPYIARQNYLYPTATPTPAGYQYVIVTGSLSAFVMLVLTGIGILAYLVWYSKDRDRGGTHQPISNLDDDETTFDAQAQNNANSMARARSTESLSSGLSIKKPPAPPTHAAHAIL